MYFSNTGHSLRNRSYCSSVQNPITCSTPGAVVPAAIEDDDLAGRREVLHVALHVHLALLAIRRRRQRHEAEDARADALGDRLDRAALAGGVAPLEDHDRRAGPSPSPSPAGRTACPAAAPVPSGTSCSSASSSGLSFFAIDCRLSATAASRRRACGRARRARAARRRASAPAAAAAGTGPDRRSGSRCSWPGRSRSASAPDRTHPAGP